MATSDEFITLLTTASGTDVGKVFKGSSSRQEPFAIGKEFYCTKEPVYDLQSLSKVLQRLENDPTQRLCCTNRVNDVPPLSPYAPSLQVL